MAPELSRRDIDEIRAQHPIEEVVAGSGVQLHRTGSSLVGCCPFHDDGTASLSVGGVEGRYHCFGCGAGGDVIDYIARLHHLRFRDAVAFLQHRSPATPAPPRPRTPVHPVISVDRAYEVNQLAWQHYSRPVAHAFAIAHVRRTRGLDLAPLEEALHRPVITHTGSDWTTLLRHLTARGVTDEELLSLDLVQRTRRGTLIDTFRERLVVPVSDADGRISGFIGRDTTGRPKAPKYRNPTRTPVFDKATMLYTPGLVIPDGADVIVVEGPIDALAVAAAAQQLGMDLVAVSTGGAHATPAQVRQIVTAQPRQLTVALDADTAGDCGAAQWITAVHATGLPLQVAQLPRGLDPAQLLADGGPRMLNLITHAPLLRPVRHASVDERTAGDALRLPTMRTAAKSPPPIHPSEPVGVAASTAETVAGRDGLGGCL